MALAAAQVVDALAALIAPQANLGTGGVKTSRAWPWAEADLPACRVFASDESVEPVDLAGALNQHTLGIDAEYTLRAVADLDDAMHARAASGLALLFAGTPPYALTLTGIEREMATEGEAAVGRITLKLQTTFMAAPSAPETITSL
jgi:hypothetical protein